MVKNVEDDRRKDISSFGIVDRDSLMQQQKWLELWETDDIKYKKSLIDLAHPSLEANAF